MIGVSASESNKTEAPLTKTIDLELEFYKPSNYLCKKMIKNLKPLPYCTFYEFINELNF